MTTVMCSSCVWALCDGAFTARAANIILPDGPTALTKVSPLWGTNNIPKLSACHSRVIQIPYVITHGSPLTNLIDLHPPRAEVTPIDQFSIRFNYELNHYYLFCFNLTIKDKINAFQYNIQQNQCQVDTSIIKVF